MFSFSFLVGIISIFLIGLFCLTAVNTAFRRLHRKETIKELHGAGKLFFYRKISSLFFPKHEFEDIYLANLFTQNVLRFAYAVFAILLIAHTNAIEWSSQLPDNAHFSENTHWPIVIFYLFIFFFLLFFIGDFLGRIVGNRYPRKSIAIFGVIVSIYITLISPLIYIFLSLFHKFSSAYMDPTHEPDEDVRHELMEMIEEYTVDSHLDLHDRKLLESVMEFKNRIAREVMVPRVSIFCLPSDTSIKEAANLISQEGYSRIPVYKDSLDNIVGVLMYKDILTKYMEQAQKGDPSIFDQPIAGLVKNVLYTPETKKIGILLQEFRKKQVHLAIIVDEYGGTEGIVTIEDILEEIVGDISDEYDETEALYIALPEGGWLIDARMSIFEIEEHLDLEIPQEGDYDTIGGYIFHETGMIPPKGFVIQKPNFELEVIRSNERRVEKVRIKTVDE